MTAMIGRMDDLLDKVAALRREGSPFALATVVARRAPVSAHLGDRAIIFGDGRMEGFVGGACSREIIRKQGLDAIRTRHARLVSISPVAVAGRENDGEHVTIAMTCASEGAVDVYVEPFLEPRRLVIVGATPVAEALSVLGRALGYQVSRIVATHEQRDLASRVDPAGTSVDTLDATATALSRGGPDLAAVVASQGHYDEEALEAILTSGRASYVGLVASRKRGATVRAFLEERRLPGLDGLRSPAGLDLGARTPSEVALSILAEIVQQRPSGGPVQEERAVSAPAAEHQPAVATDPVCGMEVEVAGARHQADVDGVTYYFCCANCRSRFLKAPQEYRPAAS